MVIQALGPWNVSTAPPLSVAALLNTTRSAYGSTLTTVVFAGMPAPVTVMPGANRLVENIATVVLPTVVSPNRVHVPTAEALTSVLAAPDSIR